jgi:hypothetical protein
MRPLSSVLTSCSAAAAVVCTAADNNRLTGWCHARSATSRLMRCLHPVLLLPLLPVLLLPALLLRLPTD